MTGNTATPSTLIRVRDTELKRLRELKLPEDSDSDVLRRLLDIATTKRARVIVEEEK